MSNAITKDTAATEGCAAVAGYVGRAPVNLADLKTCLERVQLEVRTCQDMSNLLDLPLVMQIGMSVEASLQAMITIVRATPHTKVLSESHEN